MLPARRASFEALQSLAMAGAFVLGDLKNLTREVTTMPLMPVNMLKS